MNETESVRHSASPKPATHETVALVAFLLAMTAVAIYFYPAEKSSVLVIGLAILWSAVVGILIRKHRLFHKRGA